jgi:hypothetical protein
MSEVKTSDGASADDTIETVEQRGRWKPWQMRLRIIVLGVSLGLVAKWIQSYWSARRAPTNPPAQVKDASEKK